MPAAAVCQTRVTVSAVWPGREWCRAGYPCRARSPQASSQAGANTWLPRCTGIVLRGNPTCTQHLGHSLLHSYLYVTVLLARAGNTGCGAITYITNGARCLEHASAPAAGEEDSDAEKVALQLGATCNVGSFAAFGGASDSFAFKDLGSKS